MTQEVEHIFIFLLAFCMFTLANNDSFLILSLIRKHFWEMFSCWKIVSFPTWVIISKPWHLRVLRCSKAKGGENEELEGWPQPTLGSLRALKIPQLHQRLSLCPAWLPWSHQKLGEMIDISHWDVKTCSELQPLLSLFLWSLGSGLISVTAEGWR